MNKTQLLGTYYGYPECCIAEFDKMIKKFIDGIPFTPTRKQKKAGNGTGFIPCKKHTNMIASGEITLESLIHKRVCTAEFPDSGSPQSSMDYVGRPRSVYRDK